MKEKYTEPVAELIKLENADIITVSNEKEDELIDEEAPAVVDEKK